MILGSITLLEAEPDGLTFSKCGTWARAMPFPY